MALLSVSSWVQVTSLEKIITRGCHPHGPCHVCHEWKLSAVKVCQMRRLTRSRNERSHKIFKAWLKIPEWEPVGVSWHEYESIMLHTDNFQTYTSFPQNRKIASACANSGYQVPFLPHKECGYKASMSNVEQEVMWKNSIKMHWTDEKLYLWQWNSKVQFGLYSNMKRKTRTRMPRLHGHGKYVCST